MNEAMPPHAEALFDSIMDEVRRVYWNQEQEEWKYYYAPNIPGLPQIVLRPFAYDCSDSCPFEKTDCHSGDCPIELPNFEFDGLSVWWYKYPGRGMTASVVWSPDKWCAWYDRCFALLHDYDLACARMPRTPAMQ